ncbi:hypothetical protein [Bradyrhizobium vignae]|uniref:hypothetical protein n=1 Tax=Bradyrhizobium vignae TaxID=1549949 RepID=UPI000EFDF895|nr:hypothetical protein [Bradyrhizobium vignae]
MAIDVLFRALAEQIVMTPLTLPLSPLDVSEEARSTSLTKGQSDIISNGTRQSHVGISKFKASQLQGMPAQELIDLSSAGGGLLMQ